MELPGRPDPPRRRGTPPFEQAREPDRGPHRRRATCPSGTRLPTVRALAGELGLAVNTVARVYKELEADGLVVTEGRRGTRVTVDEHQRRPRPEEAAAAYVEACRRRTHPGRGHPAGRAGWSR